MRDGDGDDAQAFLGWYEQMYGTDPRRAEPDTLLERQDAWAVEYRAGAEKRARSRYLDALAESEEE